MFRQRAKGSLKLSDIPLKLKLRICKNIMEYPFVITPDVFNKLNILLILKLLHLCLLKKFYSTNVIRIRLVRRGPQSHSTPGVVMPRQCKTSLGVGSSRANSSQPWSVGFHGVAQVHTYFWSTLDSYKYERIHRADWGQEYTNKNGPLYYWRWTEGQYYTVGELQDADQDKCETISDEGSSELMCFHKSFYDHVIAF